MAWRSILGTPEPAAEKRRALAEYARNELEMGVAIPAEVRAEVWKALTANEGCQRRVDYFSGLAATESTHDSSIDKDITRTFGAEVFRGFALADDKAPLIASLREVLHAVACHDPAVGYCQGMSFIAGFLLCQGMPPEDSFYIMVALLEAHGLRGLYTDGLMLVQRSTATLDNLVAERFPLLQERLAPMGIGGAMYAVPWYGETKPEPNPNHIP